jgi:HlyD family secretion protein
MPASHAEALSAPALRSGSPAMHTHSPHPWLFSLVLALLIGALGALIEVHLTRPLPTPPVLLIAPITKGAVVGAVRAAGILKPVSQTVVAQAVDGRLVAIEVAPGDTVRAGQIIARVDALATGAALADAEARAVGAEASNLEAQIVMGRLMRLLGMDRGREAPALDADDEEKLAVAQLRVQRTDATLRAREADVRVAQDRLRRAVIRAPLSGVVVGRHAEPGALLAGGSPVVTIAADPSHLHAVVYVAETEISRLRPGQRARLTVPGLPGRGFVGQLETVGALEPRAGEPSRAAVTVAVENAAGDLKAGMSAALQIETSSKPGAFRVPLAALQFSPGFGQGSGSDEEPAIWLGSAYENLRRIPVELRSNDGRFAEVSAPELMEGAAVVVGYAATRAAP